MLEHSLTEAKESKHFKDKRTANSVPCYRKPGLIILGLGTVGISNTARGQNNSV